MCPSFDRQFLSKLSKPDIAWGVMKCNLTYHLNKISNNEKPPRGKRDLEFDPLESMKLENHT